MKNLLILSSKKYPDSKSVYDVKIKDNVIKLFYSEIDNSWTNPGQLGYTLENTGDGFIFKDCHMNEEISISYCQAEALRALLKLEDQNQSTFNLFKKV